MASNSDQPIVIRVGCAGRAVEWQAMSRSSALRQARFEADRGANVVVRQGAKIIFPKTLTQRWISGHDWNTRI